MPQPSCVRERDRTGKTALHYCAENATADIVQLLLLTTQPQEQQLESLLDAADDDGYTVSKLQLTSSIDLLNYLTFLTLILKLQNDF